MDAAVFSEAQVSFNEQGFGHVKHRLVGSTRREVRVSILKQHLGRVDRTRGLIQPLLRLILHVGIASTRTLVRKGVPPPSQSGCRTKTLLTLTPYFSDSSAPSSPTRSTSAQ